MRIAFLDASHLKFCAATPFERPLGGSQSALCYLSAELARLGHAVTIFNGCRAASDSDGIQIRNVSDFQVPGVLNTFDFAVVLNSAVGHVCRRDLSARIPLILWTQYAHDQPSVRQLHSPEERESWTGIVFVSNWQRDCYESVYSVPRAKSRVLRNAVCPAFADLGFDARQVAIQEPLTLFYASTPFRGLDVLLQAFPKIRDAVPGTRLRVFSSMDVYQLSPEQDQYHFLYERCRSTPGVEYVGSVGQRRLAEELRGAAALSYPSTFAETSCIAVLEAMALGAAVLTTRLGALPETAAGWASMVEWQADKFRLASQFAALAVETLRAMREDPSAASAQRLQRIDFVRENYLWPARALEWVQWLSELGGRAA